MTDLELTDQEKGFLKQWVKVKDVLKSRPCLYWRERLLKARRNGITAFTVDEIIRRSDEYIWATSFRGALEWLRAFGEVELRLPYYEFDNLISKLRRNFHGLTPRQRSKELDRVLYNK